MSVLYQIGIRIYVWLMRLVALWNPKARLWLTGRSKQLLPNMSQQKTIWLHCASVGEYEQAKPIITGLKKSLADHAILVSFFSPSGYTQFDHDPMIDHYCYLPIDKKKEVEAFLKQISPNIAIFVKYEFWYNMFKALNKNQIPTFVIAAIFRKQHFVLKPWGRFIRTQLKQFRAVLVQDKASQKRLEQVGLTNVLTVGDPRIDRVRSIRKQAFDTTRLDKIIDNRPCLVAGSTWPKDEKMLLQWKKQKPDNFLILAPHEFNTQRISALCRAFGKGAIRYSEIDPKKSDTLHTIIIDEMGILKYLYRIGQIAYVGGAFGTGLHNILEASVYNIPVVFGPDYQKFDEAKKLISRDVAFSYTSCEELIRVLTKLEDPLMRIKIGQELQNFFGHYPKVAKKTVQLITELSV